MIAKERTIWWALIVLTAIAISGVYEQQINVLETEIQSLKDFPKIYRNQELRNSYFINATFTNIVARSCIFENCTIYESKLINCYTMNSTVVNTIAIQGGFTPRWVFDEVFQDD